MGPKWCYQVKLAEIDAETEEDFDWYWPGGPREARPEFDSATEALDAGKDRYPGCEVRAVLLECVRVDANIASVTAGSSIPTG